MTRYEKIGIWSFYIGLIVVLLIAIISPATGYSTTLLAILAVLGILVGLLNIQDREVNTFLIAAIALMIGAGSLINFAAIIPYIGEITATFLRGLVVFIAPASAIVAIKAFLNVARER
jgi:uncharacterized membrane protein